MEEKILDIKYYKQQECLANAKVSTRQPWYIGRNSLNRHPLRIAHQYQRNLYIVEKYFQCATIPSLTMWVYLHSFSRCCLPNMPTSTKNSEKIWTYSSSRSSKVNDFGTNRKLICDLLINSSHQKSCALGLQGHHHRHTGQCFWWLSILCMKNILTASETSFLT